MNKILFSLTLIYSITSYGAEKTLLCSGIKHTGGSIAREASLANQEQINFNYSFDDTLKTLTIADTFLCDGHHQLPLVKTVNFNKNEIYFHSKTSDKDSAKCVNKLILNRNSGELKWLQIIGDIYAPSFIYEGKFQCELAKQKF
jgi:hypothetical protein